MIITLSKYLGHSVVVSIAKSEKPVALLSGNDIDGGMPSSAEADQTSFSLVFDQWTCPSLSFG